MQRILNSLFFGVLVYAILTACTVGMTVAIVVGIVGGLLTLLVSGINGVATAWYGFMYASPLGALVGLVALVTGLAIGFGDSWTWYATFLTWLGAANTVYFVASLMFGDDTARQPAYN